jgi:transposase-like protein
MTDTPETENLARGNHVVPTEFAEQLERELAEVTKQRDRLGMALQELCEALLTDNPRDITKLLNKAGDAIQFATNPKEL